MGILVLLEGLLLLLLEDLLLLDCELFSLLVQLSILNILLVLNVVTILKDLQGLLQSLLVFDVVDLGFYLLLHQTFDLSCVFFRPLFSTLQLAQGGFFDVFLVNFVLILWVLALGSC
jgi:hypothetical protein